MKIHPISDVHLEHQRMSENYAVPECDVVVLAGDIAEGTYGVRWAIETFKNIPVCYTPGNHEGWGNDWHRLIRDMKALAEGTNVNVLYNDTVVIGDVRFIGGTLWTDYDLYGTWVQSSVIAQQGIGDFHKIYMDNHKIMVDDILRENAETKMYFGGELAKEFDGKTVVISHHVPSEMSLHEKYKGDELNPAYASRMENMILYNKIDAWFFGHTHDSSDIMLGNCRIMNNPRGYGPHAFNKDFNPELVVEI